MMQYIQIQIYFTTNDVPWQFHKWVRFYRAANGIFAKLGRLASEEVILELIMKKCIPFLLYGLEVCDLPKRTIQSLDFSVRLTVF